MTSPSDTPTSPDGLEWPLDDLLRMAFQVELAHARKCAEEGRCPVCGAPRPEDHDEWAEEHGWSLEDH